MATRMKRAPSRNAASDAGGEFDAALRAALENETLTRGQRTVLKAGGVHVAQLGHKDRGGVSRPARRR